MAQMVASLKKKKKAKTNKQKMPLQVFHAGKKYFSFYSRWALASWTCNRNVRLIKSPFGFWHRFCQVFQTLRWINPIFWKCSTQTSWLQTIKMSFFLPLMSSFVNSNVLDWSIIWNENVVCDYSHAIYSSTCGETQKQNKKNPIPPLLILAMLTEQNLDRKGEESEGKAGTSTLTFTASKKTQDPGTAYSHPINYSVA